MKLNVDTINLVPSVEEAALSAINSETSASAVPYAVSPYMKVHQDVSIPCDDYFTIELMRVDDEYTDNITAIESILPLASEAPPNAVSAPLVAPNRCCD
jgi:hypothetical protein